MKKAPLKKLSLNKETIRTLTPDQLDDVAGGTTPSVITITVSILTSGLTGVSIAYSIARTSLVKPQ
jgi:hypothetical protein